LVLRAALEAACAMRHARARLASWARSLLSCQLPAVPCTPHGPRTTDHGPRGGWLGAGGGGCPVPVLLACWCSQSLKSRFVRP
jgi:hypothetical protein